MTLTIITLLNCFELKPLPNSGTEVLELLHILADLHVLKESSMEVLHGSLVNLITH